MRSHFVTGRFLGQLRPDLPATAIVCQKDAAFVSMLKTDEALHAGHTRCDSCLGRCTIAEQNPERLRATLQVKGGKRANPSIAVVGWSSMRQCPDEDKATGEQNR